MKNYRDLPLQRKMLVMTLLICGAVLCVAIAALFGFQVLNFRAVFRRDAETLAAIVANNNTAAMAFKDDKVATQMLEPLKARSSVSSAWLALPDGELFAHYGSKEDAKSLSQFPPPGQSKFVGGDLLLTQLVREDAPGKPPDVFGTLYLRADYKSSFIELLRFYGFVVLGIVVVSICLATFLSGRLGRTITDPVLELARTAQVVGEVKDYTVRAMVGQRGDELGSLTVSFNDMLSKIQTQDAALSLSQQKMEGLIHAIDGIVWERAAGTFAFTFISRQSATILGYEPEAWEASPNFWQEKLHPQDSARAIQNLLEAAARGQPYSYEYRMLAADGREVWIRESGTVRAEKGQAVAMRGIFQNITKQKNDAEQLDRLNRQLVDTSRQAGMAEVATGVLHNVGNILNSVSVSATLVADRLRDSNVTNLCRATAMLRQQNGHLVEFLTTHPKGRLIPEYVVKVSDLLAEEQTLLIKHMTAVAQHIEHIKEIVAMQQSYAKVSGVYEKLQLAGLVEDAIRMNSAALDRHRIELAREFEPDMPVVTVDRHKVLQILVNLLRNAKHAMDGRSPEEKRMVVRVGMASPGRCKISVKDNGIGIASDLATKIFNHGFTTKKEGHGFGLHSGANAAKEMGGTLTMHSEGPGKGAEFTLELPIEPPEPKGAKESRS